MSGILRGCRWAAVILAVGGLLPALPADTPPPERGKPRPANRLARETSPYLLQHAHNPVDWFPWGPEAFAKARKENKLVFLSVGYSSCHWCHVMEKESFANEEVAQLLNRHFVCIKVDREERPDVDNVYMTALNVMGPRGGWPLSMFLTPDGKPVVGGTYWPREDRTIEGETVRGFKTVLKAMQGAWENQRKEVLAHADKVARHTTDALAGAARGKALVELKRDLVTGAVTAFRERFDPVHGGFGMPPRFRGPKFPTPPALLLLLHEAGRGGAKEAAAHVTLTLDRMARGGIYDQLGGGFHRYSTERTWTVPHFEKMLYDNAQLLEVYAAAYRADKKPEYARVLRETVAFVARELTSPERAFYSALDADSAGEEGTFYVWTAKEIEAVLKERADADLFEKVYGIDGMPNFEGKAFVLTLPRPLAEVARERKVSPAELAKQLAPLRRRLFEARAKRPRPFLDTKVLTAWNGQMIAGLARAGQALGEKEPVEKAARAADFVLRRLKTKEGRLLRSYGAAPGQKATARLNAYLDDYAYLVHGLLALHDATGAKRWLDEAQALTDTMLKVHADPAGGALFYTSNDHEKLFARAKDQYDGAQPSGNSVAAANLVRLWRATGNERYGQQAEQIFRGLAGPLASSPASLPTLADALAMYLEAKERKP